MFELRFDWYITVFKISERAGVDKIRLAILLKIHRGVEMDPQDDKSSCERETASFCPRLRTVPTFVSAHTLCASRKPWFKRARAGVDIDAINYATKHTTKIKAKFFYGDQINFIEPVLKPGRPE